MNVLCEFCGETSKYVTKRRDLYCRIVKKRSKGMGYSYISPLSKDSKKSLSPKFKMLSWFAHMLWKRFLVFVTPIFAIFANNCIRTWRLPSKYCSESETIEAMRPCCDCQFLLNKKDRSKSITSNISGESAVALALPIWGSPWTRPKLLTRSTIAERALGATELKLDAHRSDRTMHTWTYEVWVPRVTTPNMW